MAIPIVGRSLELSLAHLAELVDALVLGTSGFGRGGSSPPVGIPFPNLVARSSRLSHLR